MPSSSPGEYPAFTPIRKSTTQNTSHPTRKQCDSQGFLFAKSQRNSPHITLGQSACAHVLLPPNCYGRTYLLRPLKTNKLLLA
jgi:hypothetical protein